MYHLSQLASYVPIRTLNQLLMCQLVLQRYLIVDGSPAYRRVVVDQWWLLCSCWAGT